VGSLIQIPCPGVRISSEMGDLALFRAIPTVPQGPEVPPMAVYDTNAGGTSY
jgi:hypothetical protein